MTDANADKHDRHFQQQLSAMLDGELAPDEAKFMLRRLEHDGELASCWERWQVCGDILRGRHEALLPGDFSQRVRAAIAGETSAVAIAVGDAGDRLTARRPRWLQWGGGAALAASVAIVALFAGRQSPTGVQDTPETVAVAASASGAPVTAAAQTPTPAPSTPSAPDAATSTLATAVAVAELPRRVAERRSRAQSQRAALRSRARDEAASQIAVASLPMASQRLAPGFATAPHDVAILAGDGLAAESPFAAHPVTPSRPWPRAIVPGFGADRGLTASYGAGDRNAFHPFDPDPRLPAAPADDVRTGTVPPTGPR